MSTNRLVRDENLEEECINSLVSLMSKRNFMANHLISYDEIASLLDLVKRVSKGHLRHLLMTSILNNPR
jgi:hypothetical protein